MKTLAVDGNNDLYLDAGGSIAVNNDLAAFMQKCDHLMQSLFNEMLLDQGRGLPYEETIWTGNPNRRLFEAHARRKLLAEEGALAVEAMKLWKDGHNLHYAAAIRSVYGTGNIGGGNVRI